MLLELAWRKIFVSLLQFLPFPRPIFHKLSYPLRSMVHTWGLSVLCFPPNKVRKFFKLTEEEGRTWRDERLFCRPEYSDHQTDTHLICETFQKGESRRGDLHEMCTYLCWRESIARIDVLYVTFAENCIDSYYDLVIFKFTVISYFIYFSRSKNRKKSDLIGLIHHSKFWFYVDLMTSWDES